METGKINILIYEKDRKSLDFLKGFFSSNRKYKADFVFNLESLKKSIKRKMPYVLIAGSPSCIGRASAYQNVCPLIAMVSKDVTKGIRGAVANKVEHYIIPPYYPEDLEYKLELISQSKTFIERIYQEKKDIEAIAELTYLISSTLNPQKVLYLIVKKLSELMPISRCSILSINFSETSKAVVMSSFENPEIRHLQLDLGKYPEIGKALRTKKAVVIKDALKDPLMKKVRPTIAPLGIRSIIVVPMIFRSEVIGTLFLRTSSKTHLFSEREIGLCRNVAKAAANALYNAFLHEEIKAEREELQRLSITDFLTGVYNIRYLYHRLETEFSRSRRYKHPLGCLMLDIDHFKNINDTYGHRTGDKVLREFAQLIAGLTRKSDVFARYGGEEFIMLLPETSLKGATSKAKRIARAVKDHKFKDIDAQITISVGVSVLHGGKGKTQDELIKAADDALLEAKDKGRDRIVIAKH